MRKYTADEIMVRMGFPVTETGPYVSELRARVAKQCEQGMQNRSAGSWTPGSEKLTYEERAKHLLAWDWEIERRHTARVEAIDGVTRWVFNTRTGSWTLKVYWHKIPAWIGDAFRRWACDFRVWRDRRWRKIVNPYV